MDFESYLRGIPMARILGFRLREYAPPRASLLMPVSLDLLQIDNVVHGGILSTLADSAAVYLLCAELPPDRSLTSIEFKLNFLRPALLGRGDVVADAHVIQRGKRIALCEVDVWQAEARVAKGLFTYLFFELEQPRPRQS